MPLDHISHVFRAIWKNYIFNILKPIEKIMYFICSVLLLLSI